MVQILPYVPSFGEKLMPVLSESIGNIAKGYQQQRANKNDENILAGLANNPNATPLDQISAFNKLSKEKRDSITPLFTQYMKTQQKQQEVSGKRAEETQKEQKKIESTDNILKNLEGLKSYVGSQFGTKTFGGPLRRETVQKRRHIDSEAIALEGFFRDLATKGTLSKNVFNELLNRIPNSKMSEREYQGAIDGIRDILKAHGLESSEKSAEHSQDSTVKKGTKISDDVVDQLLSEAGGDPVEARKKAKELGYSF